jgi:hypothetical protein
MSKQYTHYSGSNKLVNRRSLQAVDRAGWRLIHVHGMPGLDYGHRPFLYRS